MTASEERPATGAPGVTFRFLREGEEPALVRLFQQTFGRWPTVETEATPEDYLRWKMRRDMQEPYHCVAELDGEIVASQLSIVEPFKVRRQSRLALRAWDVAVRPDVQGQGIMRGLRRFARDALAPHCDFQFGAFTTSPAMLRLHELEGRIPLGAALETMIAPLTFRAALSAFKLRQGRAPAKLGRSTSSLARWLLGRSAQRPATESCTVRDAERFDGRIEAFAEEASRPFDLLIDRRQAFLNWRYADRRGGVSTIMIAEDGERLLGYAVLRHAYGHAHLADMLVLPGRPDVVRALAQESIARLRAEGAAAVECLIPSGHTYTSVLQSCGFAGRRKRKARLSYLPLRASAEELSFLHEPGLRMHLMIGDSDTV